MFNSATFWSDKPACISRLEWLCHPANLQALPIWTKDLISLLDFLSRKTGATYIKQKTLAERFGVTVRWVKSILSRLQKIGLIAKDRRRINHYRIINSLPSSPSTKAVNTEIKEEKKAKSLYPYRLCLMFAEWCRRQGGIRDAAAFSSWLFWTGKQDQKIRRWAGMMGDLMVGG